MSASSTPGYLRRMTGRHSASAEPASAEPTSAEPTGAPADKERAAEHVSQWWPAVSGAVALIFAAGLGALIAYREGNLPFRFDSKWMEEVIEHRSPVWDIPAYVMNWVGGGIFGVTILPILTVIALCVLKRFWGALYFAIATIMSVVVVQLLKGIFRRPRPEDILVTADIGSFPSGHVANAATMAVVIGFLLQRTWVWVAGVVYTVLMMVSRTYLGAHWISDTVGGLMVGSALAIIVWAPLAHRLHVERRRPPTIGSREADVPRV